MVLIYIALLSKALYSVQLEHYDQSEEYKG